MPKWGLSMTEGRVDTWLKQEGDEINKGDEVLDVETDKISSSVEAPFSGVLRRQVAKPDETLPVGALLAVVVEGEAEEAEIDALVQRFQAEFVAEGAPIRPRGRPHRRQRLAAACCAGSSWGRRHAAGAGARFWRRPQQLAVQPPGIGR